MALAKMARQRTVQRREQESSVQAHHVVVNPLEPHPVSDLPSLEGLGRPVVPVVIVN